MCAYLPVDLLRYVRHGKAAPGFTGDGQNFCTLTDSFHVALLPGWPGIYAGWTPLRGFLKGISRCRYLVLRFGGY